MFLLRLSLIMALLLHVYGCSVPKDNAQPTKTLYQLKMPLSPFSAPISVSQVVTFKHGGRQDSLPFLLELSEQQVLMSALASWGAPLFVLRYDGEKIDYLQEPIVATGLQPEYILTDLFLTFWPASELSAKLTPLGYHLTENEQSRLISFNNQPVITIQYQGNASHQRWLQDVQFIQHQLGYQLSIAPISLEFLKTEPLEINK